MNIINQAIFVLLAISFLSIAPAIGLADLTQDCIKGCSDQKASDDANCQGPNQGADQGRALCLKNNQDIYNNCMENCSPSSPPAATSPQSATPQTAAPQGATQQGTAPQGAKPAQGAIPPKTY